MKLIIDTDAGILTQEQNGATHTIPLYSIAGFEALSYHWLKVGWNEKYPYTFSWMGLPIIQIPEDVVRTQEALYRIKPDVLIETGIAHGGSLIFYASLFKAMGKGRVIGVDIEIRPHNRAAIEAHEMFPLITLLEGSSTDPIIAQRIQSLIKPGETVMVILDSNHTKAHVAAELEIYHAFVTPSAYIVATDGSMKDLYDVPRGKANWVWDNPAAAAAEFAQAHPEFILEQPAWPFNESGLSENITHWLGAWLRRA